MQFRVKTSRVVAVILVLCVFGCADNAKQTSQILKADAGSDVSVQSGEPILLDAGKSSSDGSLSYAWSQIDGPFALFEGILRDRKVQLTAPAVATATIWIVELAIHDGKSTAKDQLQITVTPSSIGASGPKPEPQPAPVNTVTVNAMANPSNGGTVVGAGDFDQDSSVMVTASPAVGYHFVGWTEGTSVVSTTAVYTFMATQRNLVANFEINTYALATTANPGIGGSVEGGGIYPHGNNVTVTATAKTGYGFVNWTEGGAEVSTSASFTLYITGARNLVANFNLRGTGPKLELQNGKNQVSLSWPPEATATAYNIYYAQQPGVTPDNYGALTGGTALINISSPRVITGLTNGTDYYFIVTSFTGKVESMPSNQVGARPRAPQPKRTRLNDTGIETCSDISINRLVCPLIGYTNQDGDNGRDAQARAGTLAKTGGGLAGFDFTKIGANGDALANDANVWNCVRDNVTGLWWEVKTNDGGLRDMNATYTWTSQTDLVVAVNKQGLCGFNDWRLPTRDELLSIVDYRVGRSGQDYPTIDIRYFPNTQLGTFWSSSPSARSADSAWSVSSSGGAGDSFFKSSLLYVRLVRAGG